MKIGGKKIVDRNEYEKTAWFSLYSSVQPAFSQQSASTPRVPLSPDAHSSFLHMLGIL